MFDEEDVLLAAAAFIVVLYRIKQKRPEYFELVRLTKVEVNAKRVTPSKF